MSAPASVPGAQVSPWQRAWLVFKVIEVRLRFIAILVVTGLVIGYWETLVNHWDRLRRPTRATTAPAAPDSEFYCPMHPNVVRSEPDPGGKVPKCPICGMLLSVRKRGTGGGAGAAGRVELSPERVRLGGITTEPVGFRALVREVRALGSVTYDEARLARIVTRVSGYLERLLVSRTYDTVVRGQPLVEMYSPELVVAAQELVQASGAGAVGELATAARRKLELLGLAPEEVSRIAGTKTPQTSITIRSPVAGHVIQRSAVQGAHVEAGSTLFEIADLSQVWVEAEVFESDLPFVSTGQAVGVELEALPGRSFAGTVALVHPHLDAASRTNRVRIELANPGHVLRPGMAARVRFETVLADVEPYRAAARAANSDKGAGWWCPMHPEVTADRPGAECPKCGGMKLAARPRPAVPERGVLAVAESAVIDTGARTLVYVEGQPGHFVARAVRLGARVADHFPVLEGLAAGERVATNGAFLVDAETRLNPAAGGTYVGASGGEAKR